MRKEFKQEIQEKKLIRIPTYTKGSANNNHNQNESPTLDQKIQKLIDDPVKDEGMKKHQISFNPNSKFMQYDEVISNNHSNRKL